jgi:acetoin utilization protein AcuB
MQAADSLMVDSSADWNRSGAGSASVAVGIVADAMTTTPMTVRPHESVLQLVRTFHDKRFRHLLVTDVDGRLLGIVSDRDVGRCFGAAGRPDEATLAAIRTEEIMSRDVITIDAGARLTAAIDVMYEQGVSCLPAVSGDKLVGIITTTDLMRLLRRMLAE